MVVSKHPRSSTWIPNKDDLEEEFPFKLGGLHGIHVEFWVYISYCWNQWMSLFTLFNGGMLESIVSTCLNNLLCQDSHAEAASSLTPVAPVVS